MSDGGDPEQILAGCVDVSDPAYTCYIDGQIVAMFGAAGHPDGYGSPWMLCHEDVAKAGKTMLKYGKEFVKQVEEKYGCLANICLAEHDQSKAFIEAVGFTILPTLHKMNGCEWQCFFKGDLSCVSSLKRRS
jgi:hypothetical protein